MSTNKRLTQVFESAREVSFNDSSKLVFFSDCHRGDNSWADDFAHNQCLYYHALRHYYHADFTYFELGDGDELFENRKFDMIRKAHSHVFELLRKFYDDDRLYLLYGNHDIERRSRKQVAHTLFEYYDEREKRMKKLFPGIVVHEGLILRHELTEDTIFLVHGHQGELINDRLWRLSRFLVRYLWRWLQLLGVKDPTSAAQSFKKRAEREREIIAWINSHGNQMVICGHTHRSMFPEEGQAPYFNSGSCVHPRCLTCIEIQNGQIALVKWFVSSEPGTGRPSGVLRVEREEIEEPKDLHLFLSQSLEAGESLVQDVN